MTCRSTMRATLACVTLTTCALMLNGCATVSYTDQSGKTANIKAVGYDFEVPTNPPIKFTANQGATQMVGSAANKAIEVGGATFANRAIDKVAESQK